MINIRVFDLFEIFKRGEELKKMKFETLDEILIKAEETLVPFQAEQLESEENNLYISYLKNSSIEN